MKTAYVAPTMNFEEFQPTEYVAACYSIDCVGDAIYGEERHYCDGGTFTVKDGEHGNHQDTLNGTAVSVLTDAGNANWYEIAAAWVRYVGSNWLIGLPGDWNGFWKTFENETTTMYLYGSHVSTQASYQSSSNFS